MLYRDEYYNKESEEKNIAELIINKNRNGECIVKFKLQVANLIDLNNTILNLNKMSEIYDIERIFK